MEGIRSNASEGSPKHTQGESETDDDDSTELLPLALSWKGKTRTTLMATFEAALSYQRSGEDAFAEKMFMDVLEGYENLLSPTHEDTNKVAYALANFYAECDRMADADKVLENVSRKHIVRYGIEGRET